MACTSFDLKQTYQPPPQIYKRDLEDNLKLRNAQKECENCAKDLTEVEEKLSGVDVEMIKEKEPLIQQQTQLFKEKAETEGRLKELKVNYGVVFCLLWSIPVTQNT